MPSFTLRLKDVIKLGGDNRYKAIGLDEYPIFDEAYRATLNEKIIRAYQNEEIGHETIAVFRNEMRSRMELEMPYFNGLYETDRMNIDPLNEIDLTVLVKGTQDAEASGTSSATSSSNSDSAAEARQFNYPQQQLRSNGEYMTSASQSDSESTSQSDSDETSASTSKTTSDNTQTTRGHSRSVSSLIAEYRQTLMNVDSMVVDSISDLFMGVWTTGQAFTNENNYTFGSFYTPYYRGF